MPLHDWTRVNAGTYHDFHNSWIFVLKRTLNAGLLPPSFYALSEQIAGETGPDVLTLQSRGAAHGDSSPIPAGATALAEAPPKVSYTASLSEEEIYALKRRSLVIRHATGDRVVAYIEILSPGNKDSRASLDRVVEKAIAVLNHGCHLLLIDPLPPGTFDPDGIHGALWAELSRTDWQQPEDKPATLAAYSGGLIPKAYVEPVALGDVLPAMPLFLEEDWYINVPLESTYQEAYESVPRRWREVVEGG